MGQTKRRVTFSLAVFILLLGLFADWAPALAADEYPSKPLTYTLFYVPGGRSDIVARMMAPYLEKNLGTPVIVTNNAGGAGVIGHKAVKEAKPDGYTVAQSGTTVMFQYTKGGIKLSDYTWIANVYSTPFVIAVPSTSPFKNLKELIDYARANPKKLRHGNTGTGSTTHLGSEALEMQLKAPFTQIAYKGEGPVMVGLASAEIDVSVGVYAAYRQMVDAGKIRVLAICAPERSKQLSQIPTCKEQGYDFSWGAWEAIFGPRGLDENKAVWPKLTEAIRKTIQDPEFSQKMLSIGLNVQYKPSPEITKWVVENDKEIKKIVYDLGLQAK